MAPSTLEQFIRFGTDAGEFPLFHFIIQHLDRFFSSSGLHSLTSSLSTPVTAATLAS